jgi:hypothetical protein
LNFFTTSTYSFSPSVSTSFPAIWYSDYSSDISIRESVISSSSGYSFNLGSSLVLFVSDVYSNINVSCFFFIFL